MAALASDPLVEACDSALAGNPQTLLWSAVRSRFPAPDEATRWRVFQLWCAERGLTCSYVGEGCRAGLSPIGALGYARISAASPR
jgi:hypothetical protein